MAENDSTPTPMTDADIETPPPGTQFEPAAPLKDAGVEFDADKGGAADGGKAAGATDAVKDGVAGVRQQVADKARLFVEDGKSRATGALDQLVQMLNDAAGTVDDKLGGHYGDYARNAASQVQGFADTVRNKDTDALIDDARGYVRQSPSVAIGVAAALGFAVARLVQSGLDEPQA